MRTRLTLHPHQDGAKQLRDRYRERLMCVRYRYDETKKQRWKTVKLIIEKREWESPTPRQPEETVVAIQVAAQEREVQRQVKAAGAKWNPRKVVWELAYGQVIALGLANRIVTEAGEAEQMGHLHIERSGKECPSTYR